MRLHTRTHPGMILFIVLILTVALLVIAACGGGGASAPAEEPSAGEETDSSQGQGGKEVPTMPAANFAAPTTMIDATKVAAEADSTPEAEEVDLEYGGQIYTRRCAECHGDALEGIAGEAVPIAAYELDEDGLTDLLRTGGGFGPEHLFGLDKVSPEGITALQAHMQTLTESE